MPRLNLVWVLVIAAPLVAGCSSKDGPTVTPVTTDAGSDAASDGGGGVVEACANVEAQRATCQVLPERFDASTTLAKGCYRASKTPVLAANVTLTLAPGVTIVFEEGTGLDVSETRALVAQGTAAEGICLTGDKPQRGAWNGVKLGRTEAGDHTLDYVTVEYGGSTKSDADAAGIKITSDSRVARLRLTHTVVRESQGYGLYLVGSAETPAFAGNTFTKNTLGPANVDSDAAGLLDATSSYTGNTVDEVKVRANRVTRNLEWKALGVPFHLAGNLNVDAPWVIDAPNTLVLGAEAWISVNGDAAGLRAVGAADKPIVFTGETKTRGAWKSLRFDGTNNATNRLEHVIVEYGGSTANDFNGAGVKADADSRGVTLGLANTTIRECQGFGLYLTGSAALPTFTTNTFTKNTLGPASVGAQAIHQLTATSTYTGNDVDRLRVRDDRVGKEVTWQALGVPYQLESYLHVDRVWTLAPGVTLLMSKHGWLSVAGDAAGFHAVGTAQKPITISGVEKTPGYWDSIVFDGSLNGANALEYATIEYGGGGVELGMLHAQADSHGVVLSVKNSAIRSSAKYGIWLAPSAQYNSDIETSNTFSGNALGDVLKAP